MHETEAVCPYDGQLVERQTKSTPGGAPLYRYVCPSGDFETPWSLLGHTNSETSVLPMSRNIKGGVQQADVDLSGLAPLVHTHPYAQVSHIHPPQDLSDLAPLTHTHPAPDLSDLAPKTHSHPAPDLSGLASATHTHDLSGLAGLTHTHSQYAASSHSHPAVDLSGLAAVNHTHPASSGGSAITKTTADQAVTTVAVAPVTGLSFAAAASTNYEFEYLVAITSAALTTGWLLGFTGPAAPTYFVATQEYQSSAAAWTTSTLQAFGNFPLVTAAYVAAPSRILLRIKGLLANGATAGTVQLVLGSEVAGSAITVLKGSTQKVA